MKPTTEQQLRMAITLCLPDLEHYAATHGPGPDKRLFALKAAIKASLLNFPKKG